MYIKVLLYTTCNWNTTIMERENYYTSEIQENVATGELDVKIPEQILNDMGWYEGTELEWILEDGYAILKEHENKWFSLSHLCKRILYKELFEQRRLWPWDAIYQGISRVD